VHPELLRALAKARHHDLLDRPRTRVRARVQDGSTDRLSRPRQRVGLLLVWAGSRLIGDQRSVLELTHEESGQQIELA
jgi:hypothetical protein